MSAGGVWADLDRSPQLTSVLDLRDLKEVLVVWDAQSPHAVLVAPLLEVALESSAPPVAGPSTDLTCELLQGCVFISMPGGMPSPLIAVSK